MTWRIRCSRARELGPIYQGQQHVTCVANIIIAYHCTERNQTNQRIGRQKRQAHDEGILHSLQTIILLAGIDDKDENGGSGGWPCQLVLDCRALGVELWGYRVLCNILVMRRERVARETEGADPDSCADINSAVQASVHLLIEVYQIDMSRTHMG